MLYNAIRIFKFGDLVSKETKLPPAEYKKLEKLLNSEERRKLKKFKKYCKNAERTHAGYFDCCREHSNILYGPLSKYGPHGIPYSVIKRIMGTPLEKIMDYLLTRAGEIRNIKFSE